MEGEHSSFAGLADFSRDLELLLSLDIAQPTTKHQDATELALLTRLCTVLDEYQEQSYLLDPHLEQLVKAIIVPLRTHVRQPGASLSTPRVHRLARLLYFFTKVRGAKTILRLFPHEVDDLGILLHLFDDPCLLETTTWELRYILLLWFSLVVMLPFALGSGTSAAGERIRAVGMKYLESASKERDAAVALLARYYSRPDSVLLPFLLSCQGTLSTAPIHPVQCAGLLQTLCEVVKLSSPKALTRVWPELYRLLASCDVVKSVTGGAMMSRYRVKLAGRLVLLRLPNLVGTEELVVPDEVEVIVHELLESTHNRDTIVRWSAAKYLARLAERLPPSFSHQIVEALLETFEDDSGDVDDCETALHGASLALAELARRRQIPPDLIPSLLPCVLRALLFDRKQGVQSIGAGVRDAAAYALWSLARVLRPEEVQPHATELSNHLVAVSLFDREIHIRRAASAAFQESVGRWGVFPHGIDLLRQIDFFTVGARKRAFLEAAPVVAEHEEYRPALVKHLLSVTLVHYDPEIRTLGAGALDKILRLDAEVLVPPLVGPQIKALQVRDTSKLHGALLSLAALASAAEVLPLPLQTSIRTQIMSAVSSLAPTSLSLPSRNLLLSAALLAIENSCTPDAIISAPGWWEFVDLASKQGDEAVQRSAAATMRRVSSLAACEERGASRQESAARVLGEVDFGGANGEWLPRVVERLVEFTGLGAKRATSIEGKRNGVEALAALASFPSLSSLPLPPLLDSILAGFSDYTVDQRGDVGSWVRLATIAAVERTLPFLSSDQSKLDRAISGLLKQAVERLDNVREAAGRALGVVRVSKGVRGREELWASLRTDDLSQWRHIGWASERFLPFLGVVEYRETLLEGTVLGLTSHTSGAFVDFALSLPSFPEEGEDYSLLELLTGLEALGRNSFQANRIFIPVLNALNTLFESGGLEELGSDERGADVLRQVLLLATRAVPQVKSAPRLTASVKLTIHLVSVPTLTPSAAPKLALFLTHSLAWLRQSAAEELYAVTLGWDDDTDGELVALLTETPWVETSDAVKDAAKRFVELVRAVRL